MHTRDNISYTYHLISRIHIRRYIYITDMYTRYSISYTYHLISRIHMYTRSFAEFVAVILGDMNTRNNISDTYYILPTSNS